MQEQGKKKSKRATKNTSTSKPKRPRGRPAIGHKLRGLKERFHRSYPGEDPRVDIVPPPKEDIEKAFDIPPDDEYEQLQYPPPKKHPTFRKMWAQFIENVTERENFKVGHLNSLEILCDLFVDYEDLREFIRVNGRSYQSVGRQGVVWKFFPEVRQLNAVQAQIKEYMKMLGLLLKKDHSSQSGGEKDNWE